MSVAPITPTMWARMPWHPKARICAQLDAEIRDLVARTRPGGDVKGNLERARALLAQLPIDVDGEAHRIAASADMQLGVTS